MKVRPLDPARDDEVQLVAGRMRETLQEVLSAERGAALYTLDWLRARVRWHLDPERTAQVLLAEDDGGEVVGHTIVRVELEDARPLGLVSTIYVAPAARRRGVASALLDAGEAFLRAQGAPTLATNTARTNARLIRLLEGRGYAVAFTDDESDMVRLARRA